MDVDNEDNDKIMNEISIIKKIDHPNVMKIYEYFIS